MAERTRGDLAIVLHSHMPYVEGFGTYPFGEEWLFDAFARSHLPVLDVADRLTMTVTPVLADQLEADGVRERMLAFLRRHRVDAADRDVADAGAALRPAAKAEADHYTQGDARVSKRLGGNPLRAFQEAHRRGPDRADALGGDPRGAAEARDDRRAAAAGRRRASLARAPLRRGGRASGSPSAPTSGASRTCWPSAGSRFTCLDQSAHERGTARAAPDRDCPAGRSRSRSTGRPSSWSGRTRAIPPTAPTSSTTGSRRTGCGSGRSPARPTTRPRPRSGRPSTRPPSSPPCATASSATAPRRAAAACCVFAIDTELLGHWWAEGPLWLREVIKGAELDGVRLLTLPQALARARAGGAARQGGRAGARGRASRPGTRPRSPTSSGRPAAASCACCGRWRRRSVEGAAAERAARELLALQSSDWAFMDHRGQAGDYPYPRATAHARGPARGHRLRPSSRPARAQSRPGPQSGAAARALDESNPDPLLGVPAADRGWPRPARPQAVRGAGRARRRGPRAHPRRRGVPGRGAGQRRPRPPGTRADPAGRAQRVRRLGRAHELGHAGRRRRARRPARLRHRPRPRLARRERLRPPRAPLPTRRW